MDWNNPICAPSRELFPQPYQPFNPECVLTKPMLLYIPAGTCTHVSCPAHPEGHKLCGQNITC